MITHGELLLKLYRSLPMCSIHVAQTPGEIVSTFKSYATDGASAPPSRVIDTVAVVAEPAERDRTTIRLPRAAELPHRCIACNKPAALLRRKVHQRVVYRPMWVGLASIALGLVAALSWVSWMIFPALVLAATVGLFRTESMMIEIGLCSYHNWRRRLPMYVLLGFLVLLLCCAGIVGGAYFARGMLPILFDIAIAVGALGLLILVGCSILWVATGTPRLSIVHVDRHFTWIGGASPEFLSSLTPARPLARRVVRKLAKPVLTAPVAT